MPSECPLSQTPQLQSSCYVPTWNDQKVTAVEPLIHAQKVALDILINVTTPLMAKSVGAGGCPTIIEATWVFWAKASLFKSLELGCKNCL